LFFFQAEDGIRDKLVTGVQTCALPICSAACPTAPAGLAGSVTRGAARRLATRAACSCTRASCAWTETRRERARARPPSTGVQTRSEERRVGKGWRGRGAPDPEKSKHTG